jgi:hypothetical protein
MPYETIEDLPPGVRGLPRHAQEIFRSAFNAAWQSYADRGPGEQEEVAFLKHGGGEDADQRGSPRQTGEHHADGARCRVGNTATPDRDRRHAVQRAQQFLASRHSERIAAGLQDGGFATVQTELLTDVEIAHGYHTFDIGLLAERIRAITDWVREEAGLADLPVGYFGTGADAKPRSTRSTSLGIGSRPTSDDRPSE